MPCRWLSVFSIHKWLTSHPVYNPNAAVDKRQFIPILQGIDGVLKYASETFAAQIEGSATSIEHLKKLCHGADYLTSRLAQEGYNTTFITKAICDASKQTALKSNAEIQALVTAASSRIWVVQALGSTLGNAKALCNAFSAEGGDRVGLDGDFVKQEVCGVGG